MPEPEENRDRLGPEQNSDFDRLWEKLLSPIVFSNDIEKLRTDFVYFLSSHAEAYPRSDCPLNVDGADKIGPLTARDRQVLGSLEDRFETLIAEASGESGTATIVGRFAYSDREANSIRSILVMLNDAHGLPLLYDGYTGALNRTQGAGLTEVFLDSKDAIFIRQHLSVESVQHEIGEFLTNWPAYFRYNGERRTSPIASSLWKRAIARPEVPEGVTAPDAVTLYRGADHRDFHVRFDIGDLAVVATAICRDDSMRPVISDYVMDRPILDARLSRVRPEMNEQGDWEFVPDRLLPAEDAVGVSSTLRSLNRRSREFGFFLPSLVTVQAELPQRSERLLSEFLYNAGEQDQVGAMQIDRIDLLVRSGPSYIAPLERSAVGVVATTREGNFILNSSYTRRIFEFGSVGVILLGGLRGIDQILPFYSQAAFREELGELMISTGADIDRLRSTSYLLNLVTRNCPGQWAREAGGIKSLAVTRSIENLNRATMTLHGENQSYSTVIERVAKSGLVQTISPFSLKSSWLTQGT